MRDDMPGGYDRLLMPLAQVEAASSFFLHVEAFVCDEWSELYKDPRPDDDALDEVEPQRMLDLLAKLGLRFELAGCIKEEGDFLDSFWSTKYRGTALEVILYGFAFKVIDALELDERAIKSALQSSDLIFVPDTTGAATAAAMMVLDTDADGVEARVAEATSRAKLLLKPAAPIAPKAGLSRKRRRTMPPPHRKSTTSTGDDVT